jgi:hypothetical protein
LPANSSGRSNGMPLSSLLVKIPCKSGSPHAVRGGTNAGEAGPLVLAAADVCAVTRSASARAPLRIFLTA